MRDKTILPEGLDATEECKANRTAGGVTGESNPMMLNSLATIIRWYKGRCSFEINKISRWKDFAWQPRFYDHVIRKEESLLKIREYIRNNPVNWNKDEYNSGDL